MDKPECRLDPSQRQCSPYLHTPCSKVSHAASAGPEEVLQDSVLQSLHTCYAGGSQGEQQTCTFRYVGLRLA